WLKIQIVHNVVDFSAFSMRSGIDAAARKSFNIPSEGLLLVSVMRLSVEKQPLLWASAVIEIARRRQDVNFVLVGDGPLRQQVEQAITEAGCKSRVHLIPRT